MRLVTPSAPTEPASPSLSAARYAGEQDENGRHDPHDSGEVKRDADGPYERCDEHGNQDADHCQDSFPWVSQGGCHTVASALPGLFPLLRSSNQKGGGP